MSQESQYVMDFKELSKDDVNLVGGKNANIGEMTQANLPVPSGFAITCEGFKVFMLENGLFEYVNQQLSDPGLKNADQVAKAAEQISKRIREKIDSYDISGVLAQQIIQKYNELGNGMEIDVAVRSSATAEDLPDASFAGQQETYLNVRGVKNLLKKIVKCISSLYTPRAIFYRQEKGFKHENVYLSVAVQKMVNAKSAGVTFTNDTDSGNENVIVIESNHGLGEVVVRGDITPDRYFVFKKSGKIISKALGTKLQKTVYTETGTGEIDTTPEERSRFSLTDFEVEALAKYGKDVLKHYGIPMDSEWAIDQEGNIFLVQSRPETVFAKGEVPAIYKLLDTGEKIAEGTGCGLRIGVGPVIWLDSPDEIGKFKKGYILATKMTNPDWVPIMKMAGGIITVEGGKTCHAAIVARELHVPTIVGIGELAKELVKYDKLTIDCTTGRGIIYKGAIPFEVKNVDYQTIKDYLKTDTQIMMNMAVPEQCLLYGKWADGYGLVRMEFLYENVIGMHPNGLRDFDKLKEKAQKLREGGSPNEKLEKELAEVEKRTKGYELNRLLFFEDNLSDGISLIAASTYPNPVIVRLSDLKTNEYRNLLLGENYEPVENNPMLGWRGNSRYIHPDFEEAFRIECRSLRKAIDRGLDNIKVMYPFGRKTWEFYWAQKIAEEEGLVRGKNTEIYAMAETPVVLQFPDAFNPYVDGYSIGSNDATQTFLAEDRDNRIFTDETFRDEEGNKVAYFDERDPLVMRMLENFIKSAKASGKKVGICGEAPSTYPDVYPAFLLKCGIDSISVNSDTWPLVKKLIYCEEMEMKNPEMREIGAGYWAFNIDAWNPKTKGYLKRIEQLSNPKLTQPTTEIVN